MNVGSIHRERLEQLDPRFREMRQQRVRERVVALGKLVIAVGMFLTAWRAIEGRR